MVASLSMANATRGTAAAAHEGGSTGDIEEEPFFRHQLAGARGAAADAARRLVAACARHATPAELDQLAQRTILAAAELRIAAKALSLAAPD